MSDENETKIVQYNYKADYQHTRKIKQKASGELYMTESTVRADDEPAAILELALDSFVDFPKICKKKHLRYVTPYEKGYEPEV